LVLNYCFYKEWSVGTALAKGEGTPQRSDTMRAITIPSSLVVISLLGACAQPAPERAYVNTTAEAAGDNVDEAIDYAWSVIELDAERGVEDIEVHSVEIDAMGITHVRMQQLKDGLPVRGAEAIVHIPPASAMTLTDHFVDDNTDYTEPVIGSEEAERIALDSAGAGGEVETSSLAWMVRGEGGLRLVYEVAIDRIAAAASAPVVSVDARTGELLGQRERVHNHSYQASAEGVHAGEVTVNAVELEGTSYLVDLDARVAALDCHGLDSRSCEVAYSQTDDFNQALHGQTVDALVGVTGTAAPPATRCPRRRSRGGSRRRCA
jgi:Zn-dependent metalloprotease